MSHSLKSLAPEIFVVEHLLEPSLCEQVIQVAECFQMNTAGIQLQAIDNEIRSNDLIRLDEPHALLQSTQALLNAKITIIQKLLYEHYGIAFKSWEPCSILRYGAGQFYKRHVDNLLLASRVDEAEKGLPIRDISVVGYLNEGFEGGETYFDRQDVKVKPQAGAVLIFPAYFAYPHQSLPIIQGKKYAWTTWLFH